MKKKDPFEMYLENNNNEWDLFELPEGHNQRFLQKLKQENEQQTESKPKNRFSIIQIAAVLVPLAVVSLITFQYFSGTSLSTTSSEPAQLAEYSPELSKAQDYFSFAVEEKLEEIQALKNPENEAVINESLEELTELNQEYNTLLQDLQESGGNPAVIKSLLNNLQLRVQILEQLLTKLEYINQIKLQENETI